MKAITTKQPGGRDQLTIEIFPKPSPRKGELLIEVHSAAINRTDIIARETGPSYGTGPILGVEVSGVVTEVGEGATIPVGSRVMGLVNGGGYAEYALMPADRAIRIPDNLSFEEAAAIPEVFLTAYQTLYWHGKLQENETVLIHAGGSGVGTAAIQLASKFSKARIITTAGTDEKLNFARKLGAEVGINYKTTDFSTQVFSATGGKGVDVILDFVGASYWEKNLKSIGTDGRWVLIGILGGTVIEQVDLWDLMQKRIQLIGPLLTPRSDEYKAKLTKEFASRTLPLFENKELKPIIDKVYAFEEIQRAHERMEANKNIGKIVLRVKDE